MPGQPPKQTRAKSRKQGTWQRISADADVRRSARFLKVVVLGEVTTTLAVCMVSVGVFVIALVIHQIFGALEARKIEVPRWAHDSEVQSVGVVLIVLMLLATVIVLKDFWRVGVQGESAEEPAEKEGP